MSARGNPSKPVCARSRVTLKMPFREIPIDSFAVSQVRHTSRGVRFLKVYQAESICQPPRQPVRDPQERTANHHDGEAVDRLIRQQESKHQRKKARDNFQRSCSHDLPPFFYDQHESGRDSTARLLGHKVAAKDPKSSLIDLFDVLDPADVVAIEKRVSTSNQGIWGVAHSSANVLGGTNDSCDHSQHESSRELLVHPDLPPSPDLRHVVWAAFNIRRKATRCKTAAHQSIRASVVLVQPAPAAIAKTARRQSLPMKSCCAAEQGDDMNRILPALVSIAVLSGCTSRSNPSLQADGMDSERSLGRSVATVLICNDCPFR